ncbi:MAG: helix-turn-helix domain-containing protein [Lachnospiraceae bacterium]
MGERIKQLRSANGFTQEMLAEKMNVSVRQL